MSLKGRKLLMLMKDSESNRKIFFYAYTAASIVTYIFSIFMAYG